LHYGPAPVAASPCFISLAAVAPNTILCAISRRRPHVAATLAHSKSRGPPETPTRLQRYGAQCTPDFFGFNAMDQLQYRGRLDASRMTPVANARRDLFEAMKQVAQTGQGPQEHTPSMGCSIKWKN
jgi:hypothetical protein